MEAEKAMKPIWWFVGWMLLAMGAVLGGLFLFV